MTKRVGPVFALALVAMASSRAAAVDITGSWAVCIVPNAFNNCGFPLLDATLVAAGDAFTLDIPLLCHITGTIDPTTGVMHGDGCPPGVERLSGTATDTSMSGIFQIGSCLSSTFSGVRPCAACDDGNPCTTDGCGATACSAPGTSCTDATSAPGTPCSDGSACTTETCQYRTCQPTQIDCDDGNPCTDEVCDPVLGCQHHPNTAPCDDGDACTTNDTCADTQCVGGAALACAACEHCVSPDGCAVGPAPDCRTPVDPHRTAILLRDDVIDTRDRLVWKWAGEMTAAEDFGDPVAADGYTICVFDQTATAPRLLLQSAAPPGCPAGGPSCWSARGNPPGQRGFAYRGASPFTPDGLSSMKLTFGATGKTKISVKGQRVNLRMPSPLAVELPVTVQLQGGNGQCWEGTYTAAQTDRADVFRAKGGS